MPSSSDRDKIEEIKTRLDIVDVIGKDISLKHVGGGEYVGTVGRAGGSGESLKVSKNLQSWKDFKNGPGGDILDWIGHINGYKDTRGSYFPEILRIAADLAGVELEEATEEEKKAAVEKVDIHNLFTAAAEIYHKNLTPELYDHILQKWGITKETVDQLQIGYATTGRDLKEIAGETLNKSGLIYVNDGKPGGEVFRGRIIFPYWKNGKVVYLIGRQNKETPLKQDGKEPSKYQKLLVHSDKFPYVSPLVQNSYFYGEDSLRGSDYCIITEGVTDCIAMMQAGFPCVSPVTVRFRESDHPKLLSLVKKLGRVYICNDNEANQAGLKGALSTAEAIESEGIEARIIELPKPEGIDKIDIADYMKVHTPEDFSELVDSSVRLWDYKLSQQVVKASSTSLERLRGFKSFISNDLHLMQTDEWHIFVNTEVPEKFRLKLKDIRYTIDEVSKDRQRSINTEAAKIGEPEEKDDVDDQLKKYPEKIQELAYTILREGDAFDFMLETWNLRHVGDTNLGENCLCSVGSTYILNSDMGLHIKPSGESGKGKSDAMKEATLLLPAHKCISSSLSGKALFYDPDLKPGTIIYSDDAHLNDDIVATIKQSTSSFQEITKHRTVVNGELKIFDIPERVVFWFSSVDGISDEQLANRFLNADVDCSEAQDERVHNHINDREALAYSPIDDDVLICRCIFDILDKDRYVIKIPFSKAIDWRNKQNRRNYQKFLDIIRAVAFFNVFQRRKINGIYLADKEDFDRAVDIYTGTSKNNATNLTSKEIDVLKFIAGKNEYDGEGKPKTINPTTKQDIMKKFDISAGRAHQILHGKDGKGGMLAKVAQLNKIDKSITKGGQNEDKVTTKQNEYAYTGMKIGLEIYDTVASIIEERIPEVEKEFMKTLEEETVTYCYPTVTYDNVTVKKRTEDRIKRNVTSKRENDIDLKLTHVSKQSSKKVYAKSKALSQTVKEGNRVTVDDKNIQPMTLSNCYPDVDGGVTVGNSCYPLDENQGNRFTAELLRKALKNYAWSDDYHGVVENIPEFVGKFNERTPEYVKSLGLQAVLQNAERLSSRGWK